MNFAYVEWDDDNVLNAWELGAFPMLDPKVFGDFMELSFVVVI